MGKKIVKKSKSASVRAPRVIPNAEIDSVANTRKIAAKDQDETKPPKMHAKVVQVTLSVGADDRDRLYDEFVEFLKEKIGPVEYGEYIEGKYERKPGIHMTVTGGYYILDGKVCRPEDYDESTQNFKPGTHPPSWAGGPSPTVKTTVSQIDHDFATLTSDEYDKKYCLGKYEKKPDMSRVITPEMQRVAIEESRRKRLEKEAENLAEFDFEDDAMFEDEATESASEAIKTLKKSKTKKVVKKKPAKSASAKRVVKRGK